MTLKEKMVHMMVLKGMDESNANQIIQHYIERCSDETLNNNWNTSASSYPDPMLRLLWTGVEYAAFSWIEENNPDAWYKPMFETSVNVK